MFLKLTITALIALSSCTTSVFCWEFKEVPNFDAVMAEDLHWRYPNMYLADFGTAQIKRLDTTTNTIFSCTIENTNEISFVVPQRKNESLFVVGLRHSAVEVYWDGISTTCPILRQFFAVETSDPSDAPNCLLDGKCDAKGRLFTGTANCNADFGKLRQHLYSYANGRVDVVRNDVNISNSMAWNDERKEFYYIDTGANTITRFKYDIETGKASEPQVVFNLNTSDYPSNSINYIVMDSMTLDSSGFLYVTVFGGKQVLKISPTTWQIVERYEVPCVFPTAITFGGPNFDSLYVTTASQLLKFDVFSKPCGKTFLLTGLGVQGAKEYTCDLD